MWGGKILVEIKEEKNLCQSEAIGEALIEMKIVTEQVGELINNQV
jgi:hypothetical protein